jgi:hypothetical protein
MCLNYPMETTMDKIKIQINIQVIKNHIKLSTVHLDIGIFTLSCSKYDILFCS